MKKSTTGLVVWFCGLPGSGKSTIAEGVLAKSSALSKTITLISMDSIRKKLFPNPTYSDQERDAAYRSFVLIASVLSKSGITTLLDGTGHRLKWRNFAREECPRFVEVYVKCPVDICIRRETNRMNQKNDVRKKLYDDALNRLHSGKNIVGLGSVPGVDEPFEESPHPEIILDSSKDTPDALVNKVIQELGKFESDVFSEKR
ncbi:MAG: adenylyl-sulfate kinase [Nitrososphaerales archaeon]